MSHLPTESEDTVGHLGEVDKRILHYLVRDARSTQHKLSVSPFEN